LTLNRPIQPTGLLSNNPPPLRVAIVHYHLKRGGVTRVIESTLDGFKTLAGPHKCVVLAGEVPNTFDTAICAREVEGLQYSNAQSGTPACHELLERIRAAAKEALGGDPDIWHIHNHSLGKNCAMPGVVASLAESGASILLHMHDFAEDGRPQNYRINQERPTYASALYPDMGSIHYGVLNARDHDILTQAGFAQERLHLLANPVEVKTPKQSAEPKQLLETLGAERLFLYPVRAVRRKNFGEMLLWSALAKDGDAFATTLGPTNQNYYAAYKRWQSFAKQHKLPVHFGIGEQYDWSFETVMESAHAILSTSIAEGFGLAYLEPWLFGKAIIGRNLPDITADFTANAIELNGLYDSLPIPFEWIQMDTLRSALHEGLSAAYTAYERPLPDNAVERALSAITPKPGHFDFAGLNESLQETVIERVIEDPQASSALPTLKAAESDTSIRANAERIGILYSQAQYAENLTEIYKSICNSDRAATTQYTDPTEVLDGFLQPERFRLLRT